MSVRRASLLLVFAGGAISALLLASCGGAGSGSSTSSPAVAARTSAAPRPAQSQAPAPQGESGIPAYGHEAGDAQSRAAESSLAGFLKARAGENWAAVCSDLSHAFREHFEEFVRRAKLGPQGCAPALGMLSKSATATSPAGPPPHHLTSLRIRGEKAFALWVGADGQGYAMPMVREGNAWRFTQLAPIPDGPGSTP